LDSQRKNVPLGILLDTVCEKNLNYIVLIYSVYRPSVDTYCTYIYSTEAEFLDEIQTKVLRVFLLAIRSHLYSFALRFLFLQTHTTSYNFFKLTQPLTLRYSTL
jgi:hypothetical protein